MGACHRASERGMRSRRRSAKVLHFEPHSLNDILEEINQLGDAVGKRREALQMTAQMRLERNAIAAKSRVLPRVRLYLEINLEGSPPAHMASLGRHVTVGFATGYYPYSVSKRSVLR